VATKAVVFDLGGVLIDWDPRHLYRKLLADEAAVEEFLATVCTPEWNAELDRGRPFAEAVAELVERHPEHAAAIAGSAAGAGRRWCPATSRTPWPSWPSCAPPACPCTP
jgi:phosphoserine phosphatase